jgi:hypothetical protein
MRIRASRMPVTLLASLIMCIGTSSSLASRGIGLSPSSRAISFTSARLEFRTSIGTISCPITLTGSFLAGFQKTEPMVPGRITSANLTERSCTGGSARLLTEGLPWHVQYYSFNGLLPRISALNLGLDELAALLEFSGLGCLLRGRVRGITRGEPEIRELRVDEAVRIPVATRLSIFCPSEGTLAGTFNLSPTVRMSLLEAVLGSTVNTTPNPLVIEEMEASGTITATAVGGPIGGYRTQDLPDAGRFHFITSGCVDQLVAVGTTCTITVAPDGVRRPTRGTTAFIYVNESNIGRTAFITTEIR